jgi:hypothetical protein
MAIMHDRSNSILLLLLTWECRRTASDYLWGKGKAPEDGLFVHFILLTYSKQYLGVASI